MSLHQITKGFSYFLQNLLNYPIGQLERVASTLAGADVMTIAVVPTVDVATEDGMEEPSCHGIRSTSTSALPLELFALAMLRYLKNFSSSH